MEKGGLEFKVIFQSNNLTGVLGDVLRVTKKLTSAKTIIYYLATSNLH